jgi:hypothetical protein
MQERNPQRSRQSSALVCQAHLIASLDDAAAQDLGAQAAAMDERAQ